jgi:hypothetical protein
MRLRREFEGGKLIAMPWTIVNPRQAVHASRVRVVRFDQIVIDARDNIDTLGDYPNH